MSCRSWRERSREHSASAGDRVEFRRRRRLPRSQLGILGGRHRGSGARCTAADCRSSTAACTRPPMPPTRAVCPAFLMAIGPDGPMGYATDVSIEEDDGPAPSRPGESRSRRGATRLQLALSLDDHADRADAIASRLSGTIWTSSSSARGTTSPGGPGNAGRIHGSRERRDLPRAVAGDYFFAAPSFSWRRAPLSMPSMA